MACMKMDGAHVVRNALGVALLIASSVLAVPGYALAQETGVAGDLERSASASPQEKLQYASDAVTEVRAGLKQIEKMIEDARRTGDTDQVECLTERLTQIRALTQVTEVAQTSMKDALSTTQQDRADHELRKIAVALGKTRQLLLEAEACGDEAGLASGQTSVKVEGGLTGEGDETDPLGTDVLNQGYDPPRLSPFN